MRLMHVVDFNLIVLAGALAGTLAYAAPALAEPQVQIGDAMNPGATGMTLTIDDLAEESQLSQRRLQSFTKAGPAGPAPIALSFDWLFARESVVAEDRATRLRPMEFAAELARLRPDCPIASSRRPAVPTRSSPVACPRKTA